MTSGKSTTEFWTTLIAAVGPHILALATIIAMATGNVDANTGLIMLGIFFGVGSLGSSWAVGKYTEARSSLKETVAKNQE